MNSARIILRVPQPLVVAVEAKRKNQSVSDLVRELLAEWVGKPELAETRKRGRPKIIS